MQVLKYYFIHILTIKAKLILKACVTKTRPLVVSFLSFIQILTKISAPKLYMIKQIDKIETYPKNFVESLKYVKILSYSKKDK